MEDKSFTSELHLALARPDAEGLTRDLADYFQFSFDAGELPTSSPEGGNFAAVMDADRDDPERGLAYLALATQKYDDPAFLGLLAAGLLEDLLRDPTPEILSRILAEARKTPRFRWMLSGVWLHAIAERARDPVKGAVGECRLEQPLPPAPY
jgi:hypothetical protein